MPFSRSFAALLLLAPLALAAQPDASQKPLASRTASMQHFAGLLPLDWDAKSGRLFLEVPLGKDGRSQELLYTHGLPSGTGSNDLGLDRGQIADAVLVRFERTGPKVLLVQQNTSFRTTASDPAEQLAVTQSFPRSVLAGFTVEAESPDGTVLLDATSFALSDAHHVAEALAAKEQGSYRIDDARSAIALDHTKAFPRNTDLEAELTFVTDSVKTANFVQDVTPDPRSLTVREHKSFLELPPPGFTPRRYSPRSGYFPMSWRDYAAPLGDPLDQKFIVRHRLTKRDPNCTRACVAVAPIHYYVDRGAPEPIRTALVDGARWWDQAFQAAGWAPGTFLVDVLPADADPMDVRYNMIQWVHRYTRGWSYGEVIADPRTGEILKGNVTLGSLRGRQDYLIAEALLAPYHDGWGKTSDERDPMLQMVLARIRQLSAHETGHTLGLEHNFAASSFPHTPDQTMSVMDYPHPWITLSKDGVPDISHAYPVGIGIWDKTVINYGYREFDTRGHVVEDPAGLEAILRASEKTGMIYIDDSDGRPVSSIQPRGAMWDNGADAADELDRILTIRDAALKRFGENVIKPGTPMSEMEQTLVPLYLLHRYQTEAAIKLVAGLEFTYSVRGDGSPAPKMVPLAEQNKAIATVLKTLTPETLTLPETLIPKLPPAASGYPRTRESFPSQIGPAFDPVAAAETAADLTLRALLEPGRASRIVQNHMEPAGPPPGPSLRVLMESISKTTAERMEGGHSISSEVMRAVEFRGLEAMLSLAVDPAASSQARAIARSHIRDLLAQWDAEGKPKDSAEAIHRAAMIDRAQEFLRTPEKFVPSKPIDAPPGMPIGDDEN